MSVNSNRLRKLGLGLLAAGSLVALGTSAVAQTPFSEVSSATNVRVNYAAAERGKAIEAGSTVNVSGEGFTPGQQVSLLYGTTPLTSAPLVANAEGKISGTVAIPANAISGTHPIVVAAQAPYYATVTPLKVSPTVALSGQDRYTVTTAAVTRGLYQAGYSAKNDTLFVTSSIGRPPVKQSEIVKLNARDLSVLARTNAAPVSADESAGLFAVYGIGVDDSKGTIWTTNTRQNTVAVYNQSDLSLVKQFPAGTVSHARDVVVDQPLAKAYVGATNSPDVVAISTNALEPVKTITIKPDARGADFKIGSLSLDAAAHRLYVSSLGSPFVAVINTQTDEIENIFPIPGAQSAIGVGHDPVTGRIFIAAQGSDNLVVLDGKTGAVIANTPVGAGALNVAFDPVKRLAYVANRGAGTITVTDVDGKIVANLGPSPLANHVALGKDGTVFAVDKSGGALEAEFDEIQRISPRK